LLPSTNEFCPYATSTANPQPYLATEEFKGPDQFGLSLLLCGKPNWACGTWHTAYVCGSAGVYRYYYDRIDYNCALTSDSDGKRNVRCVRDL
jgi:hypothetical protein